MNRTSMSNIARINANPPLQVEEITGKTRRSMPPSKPTIEDLMVQLTGTPPSMAEILKKFTIGTVWVEAKLMVSGVCKHLSRKRDTCPIVWW